MNDAQRIEAPVWDLSAPYQVSLRVAEEHLDVLGHTNNVAYLKWLETIAWAHSHALGVGWDAFREHNAAMVARRHELDYLAATHLGEDLVLGTWITANDGRLTIERRYQLVRLADCRTVFRGWTHWVCVRLDNGRPRRMPANYVRAYEPVPAGD